MDAFSASLMADKREIVFAPTVYKFQTFAQMAEEFNLGERDVVLTNEFIYTPFMKELGLKCNFVFQEKFGAGEPSEAMIQTMYDAIPYDSYDRVIAVGGGAIMDLCKLLVSGVYHLTYFMMLFLFSALPLSVFRSVLAKYHLM